MASLGSKITHIFFLAFFIAGNNSASIAAARMDLPVFHQVDETRPRADRVSLRVRKKELVINIQHNGGIGKTSVELEAGDWPNGLKIIFRNFVGLEGCKFSTATRHFDASIPHSKKERFIQLGEGFSATRRGKDFYIDAPSNFVRKNEKFLRLEWVDFYRN